MSMGTGILDQFLFRGCFLKLRLALKKIHRLALKLTYQRSLGYSFQTHNVSHECRILRENRERFRSAALYHIGFYTLR